MSMYLRFKRKNQTIFITCEPTDRLQVVKEQLALIVGKDEDDVRVYEVLSDERRLSLALQQEKERQAKLNKAQNKNPYQQQPQPTLTNNSASQHSHSAALADFVQPPLDCERKVSEWGLQTDAVVLFAYRLGEGEEWEDMEADGVCERRPTTAKKADDKEEANR